MQSPHPFAALLEAARGLDLTDPAGCVAELERRLPWESAQAMREQWIALLHAGQLANRGAPPVRFGRFSKATPETGGYSIDVVDMTGAGPLHRHPRGEIDYLVPLEGSPRFEGRERGFVVLAPMSEHVPEVRGGRMLIVYLLPGGNIEFLGTPK